MQQPLGEHRCCETSQPCARYSETEALEGHLEGFGTGEESYIIAFYMHIYMCFVFAIYKNLRTRDAQEPQASSPLPILSLATCARALAHLQPSLLPGRLEKPDPSRNAAAGVCWESHRSRSCSCGMARRSERNRFVTFLAEPKFLGICQPSMSCERQRLPRLSRSPPTAASSAGSFATGSTWAFLLVCCWVGFSVVIVSSVKHLGGFVPFLVAGCPALCLQNLST